MNIRQRLLLRRIRRDDKSLTEIALIDAKIGPAATCKLVQALKDNTHVKTLWLAGNNMGDGGSEAIAEVLKCNHAIRQAILSVNGIGPAGALALASVLEEEDDDDEKAVLEVLCVGGNNLGDKGAAFLADMLRTNASLIELWLRDNNLTSTSATALAQNLQSNVALQELWLGGNELGDEGATSLAAAIHEGCCALSVLDLSNNGITDVGARTLLDSLASNHHIAKVDLSGNDITDDEILRNINSLLEKNQKRRKK
mmetsp:Transcript_22190/g.47992  ORF Transcript_22190/g.47992 Transcript_22190/m.47992 type:complete len:255 (-) Transcript_22190:1539-2303(-)